MNGLDFAFSSVGMTAAVLAKSGQYYEKQYGFVSSDVTNVSYDIGLKSKLESISSQAQDTAAEKKLRKRFNNLAETWETETEFVSSINDILIHPAHMQIIGMGRKSIPLILERMRQKPSLWFWALKYITGEDPVTEDIRGNIQAMRQAWLDWGQENEFYWY